MSIAIVTDSTSDVSRDLCEKYKINVVPLSIIFKDRSYVDDGVDITIEKFYKKLRAAETLPTTAQPSPGDFVNIYRNLLKNHDSIISIHISRKMSGTLDSTELAKKELPGKDIEIINSESVHMPLGFLVIKAAKMVQEGKSKDEIVKAVCDLKTKVTVLFIPNTLKYLKKGGRIGRAKGLIASLLDIKPILTINLGEVSQYKTTRRWNQAKNELIDSMKHMVKNGENLIVSVGDSDAKEEGDEMAERIKDTLKPRQLMRVDIGCIVGTHLGPGSIGITFYEE